MQMDPGIRSKYPIGCRPKISFVAYLIFCSYLVSLIGAFTTVELLHRRVSGSGWRSWVQVAGCAVSFGLVAIWCMHFVGNRAIILGDGEKEIQLYYSPKFTAVSAILPVAVIFIGLLVADRFYKGSKRVFVRSLSLLICGICAGAAVTEMHYLGNNGTTNYRLELRWPNVFGAAAIAVGACLVSFGLFFHWSGHWMNNIWRRIIVACFLALAVSGMHWTAAAGTQYEIRGYHVGPGQQRNTNLIIALCLCLGACAVCFLLGFMKQRHRKMLKDRAQHVVLAVATFDHEGKLLVSQSGLMPCQTITQQFQQRTFDDEFNTSHPVFQWLFRVSRNWAGIVDLIPSMREHLQSIGYFEPVVSFDTHSSRASTISEDGTEYLATFREMFCVTASEIAKSLETSLTNLGSLYEDVLPTGTLSSRTIWRDINGDKKIVATDVVTKDLETGIVSPVFFGKGQLLVLTRKVGTAEGNRLQNLGYRFASTDQVGEQLARSLQIPRDDMENLVSRLHAFTDREPFIPQKGTFLASFLVQPLMRGLDVIVPRAAPDRLPMVKLSDSELDSRQLGLLTTFNGLALDECLEKISLRDGSATVDNLFLERFRNRILDLLRDCPEASLHRAIFSAKQLDMAHGMVGQEERTKATVFAFCGIREIYVRSLQSLTLITIPMSLFKTYLRSYPGCPDHELLAHKNHREFSGIKRRASIARPPADRRSHGWPKRLRISRLISADSKFEADSSSEKGFARSTTSTEIGSPGPIWGGIMVTKTRDIIIDQTDGAAPDTEMQDLGVKTEAGVVEPEKLTLADWLMTITTAFRDPHANRMLTWETVHGRK